MMVIPHSSSSSSYLLTCLIFLNAMSLSLAGDDHFILTRISTLLFGRIDPIVNPGTVSAHAHNIMGGSCINDRPNTPAQQQACDCSSVIIGDDKSNYWAPMLYYQHTNGSFSPILNGNRVYYFLKSTDIKPFPPGLRMISGLSGQKDAKHTKTQGIRISCNHGTQTQFLPNGTSHPDGCTAIQMGIFFPSCGKADGSLTSEDNFSHMAWPIKQLGGGGLPFDDQNGAKCPASHPIKYPTIFMEVTYYLSSAQPWHSGNPLILSNGDQSGLTYHADFFDGWKQQTLKDTIAQCGLGNSVGEDLASCAPLAKTMSEPATWDCRYQGKIANEDVGLYRPITKLPGCNPVWPSNVQNKLACSGGSTNLVYPNVEFANLKYRETLPIAFTKAPANISAYDLKKKYLPSLGELYASYLAPWGSSGSNSAKLKVSTLSELTGVSSTPKNSGGDSSNNVISDPGNGVVNGVDPAPSSAVSLASTSASAKATQVSSVKSVAATLPLASAPSAAHAAEPKVNPNQLENPNKSSSTGKVCKTKTKKNLIPAVDTREEVSREIHAHRHRRSLRSHRDI